MTRIVKFYYKCVERSEKYNVLKKWQILRLLGILSTRTNLVSVTQEHDCGKLF